MRAGEGEGGGDARRFASLRGFAVRSRHVGLSDSPVLPDGPMLASATLRLRLGSFALSLRGGQDLRR
jgi:hypothetical protein